MFDATRRGQDGLCGLVEALVVREISELALQPEPSGNVSAQLSPEMTRSRAAIGRVTNGAQEDAAERGIRRVDEGEITDATVLKEIRDAGNVGRKTGRSVPMVVVRKACKSVAKSSGGLDTH